MTTDPLADAVGELVLQALHAEGSDAQVIGRPDRDNRQVRGADYLLMVDGEEVALEVTTTELEIDRRLDALGERLSNRIRAALRAEVEAMRVGRVVVYAAPTLDEAGQPPRRPQVDVSVGPIVERLRGALAHATLNRERVELGEVGVVERLTVHVYPNATHGLSVISQRPRGGFTAPIAERVVRGAIMAKSPQLAQYPRASLALVQGLMLVDPTDLADACTVLAGQIPPNWRRIWTLSAEEDEWFAVPVWVR